MKISNTFPLPSGSDENPAVVTLPADLSLLSEGLRQEAAAGELFTMPETKSPRLLWIEKHGLTIHHQPFDHAGPTDKGERYAAIYNHKSIGLGACLDDALVAAAKSLNIPLWNEV